jgi:hypothetical protein
VADRGRSPEDEPEEGARHERYQEVWPGGPQSPIIGDPEHPNRGETE